MTFVEVLRKEEKELIRDYIQYMVDDWNAQWITPSMSFAESFKDFLKNRTEVWSVEECLEDVDERDMEIYIHDLPMLKKMISGESMDDKKKNHLGIDQRGLIGKKYDMFANSRPKAFFHPCHTLWELELYAPENIVPVTVEVIGVLSTKEKEEEIEDKYPEDTYYGWYQCYRPFTKKKVPDRISMIWPRFFQFNMCFGYGFQPSQEHGQGIALALKITERRIK